VSVNLNLAPPASNKPPEPDPKPDEKLFPLKLSFPDGRTAWQSIPLPDRISIVGNLLLEHTEGVSAEQFHSYAPKLLMQGLATGGIGQIVGKPKFHKSTGTYSELSVAFGVRDAPVFFKISANKETGGHSLRIEGNPRKLGPAGIEQLLDGLRETSNHTLHVGKFLSTARVSRLDVAVDLVGLAVSDLLITSKKKAGKRTHYLGEDGALETVYVHRRVPPQKQKYDDQGQPKKVTHRSRPMGPVHVMVYDRVRERRDVLKPPPFGPAPVTRVEVVKTHFGNVPFRPQDLPALNSPFADVAVGYVGSVSTPLFAWLRYVECRRAGGHDRAAKLLHLTPKDAEAMKTAYAHHPSDVLDPVHIWSAWKAGLAITGLELLANAAATKSKGSPNTGYY
jgi:hypothetical protein